MKRLLLSMLLLFFLAFGLSRTHALMIQSTLAESADDDVSSEKREKQTLSDSGARQARAHGKTLTRPFVSQANLKSTSNKAQSSFTSLSPPDCGTGNLHGLLQVFRM